MSPTGASNQTATPNPAVNNSLGGYGARIKSNMEMLSKTLNSLAKAQSKQERQRWHSMADTIVMTVDSELQQFGSEHSWVLGNDMNEVVRLISTTGCYGMKPGEPVPKINNGKDWLAYMKSLMQDLRRILEGWRQRDGVTLPSN